MNIIRRNGAKLPPCPYWDSALVVTEGAVTAIGGRVGEQCTNELFTIQQQHWSKRYPPMYTERSSVAAVSTSEYTIVCGGRLDSNRWTACVELLQMNYGRWHKLADLPYPLHYPSATLFGCQLCIVGDSYDGHSCSLQDLLHINQQISTDFIRRHLFWSPLPSLPAMDSTATTFCEQLVA